MYFTLLDLDRSHKCPMIVKDAFTGLYFLVIRKDPETSSLYEVRPLRDETHRPELGTPVNLLYGGYNRWLFIRKPELQISPEEQKKAVEIKRKNNNESLIADLRRTSRRPAPPEKKKETKALGQVIPFRSPKTAKET